MSKLCEPIFRSIVDVAAFKNLTPKALVGGQSNSISRTFIDGNGIKFNVTEPSLKTKFDDIVANGDITGRKTEDLLTEVIEDGGLSDFKHFDGTYNNGINGFDGVFVNSETGEVIINESKQWTGVNSVRWN